MSEEKNMEIRQDQIKPGPCPPEGCPPPTEIVCLKTKKVYEECKQLETDNGKAFEVCVRGLDIPPGAETVACRGISPAHLSLDQCWKKWWDRDLHPDSSTDEEDDMIELTRHGWKGCCKVMEGKVKIWQPKKIRFLITVEFFDSMGNSLGTQEGWACLDQLPEEKVVALSRAGEPRLECEVDLFFDCLACFIETDEDRCKALCKRCRRDCAPCVICCVNVLKVVKLFAEVQLMVPAYGFCPQPPECPEEVLGECPPAVQTWPPYPPQEEDPDNSCSNCG